MPYLISPRVHLRVGWLMIAAVIVLSLVPIGPLPELAGGYDDKLAHGFIYSVLMAWFAVIVARPAWRDVAIALSALGAGLECCQALLPYRTASFADIVANTLGLVLGSVIALILNPGSPRSGRAK